MRIQNSLIRSGVLCGLTLAAYLLGVRPAAAEVTLVQRDGWTFFTEGRINVFGSVGYGDDFPAPTRNLNVDATGVAPQHTVSGSGQPFTAGFASAQGNASGKYLATRVRSGFVGSVLAFGMRRQLSETTSVKSYISLWGTAQSYARDRTLDVGKNNDTKGFDVREGYASFESTRWGTVTAGHQSGILGGISTEIDYLYAHAYGLGLPCLDIYYPTCGHIGTGALGPGFAPGFVYTTPSLRGLSVKAGVYDPVRLLGVWERVPYPRVEGSLTYERRTQANVMFKLVSEGMYQQMKQLGGDDATEVWGVSAGGRLEAGPLRLGLSAFRGKGLGVYVALQNAGSTFSGGPDKALRYFTGLYAQGAWVIGPAQFSLGLGRVVDDQLAVDKLDSSTSNLKAQTGASFVFNYSVSEHLVLDFDYFGFKTDWWGAPNSMNNGTDPVTGNPIVTILPGYLTPEKQLIHFFNVGATFHW